MDNPSSHLRQFLITCSIISIFFALFGCVTPIKKTKLITEPITQPLTEPEKKLPETSFRQIPDNVIALPLLENATFEPLLEQRITRLLKATLVSSGWKVVAHKKDAATILLGRINGFSERPVSLTPTGRAREYRINITLEMKFLSNTNTSPIISMGSSTVSLVPFEGSADYFSRADTMSHRRAKDRAVREAGKQLSRKVVSLLELQKSLQLEKTEGKEAIVE